jgi:hypothetical protein
MDATNHLFCSWRAGIRGVFPTRNGREQMSDVTGDLLSGADLFHGALRANAIPLNVGFDRDACRPALAVYPRHHDRASYLGINHSTYRHIAGSQSAKPTVSGCMDG